MVHKISDSLCGVLHLPARGQGVLLDHPATGRGGAVSTDPAGGGSPVLVLGGDQRDTPPWEYTVSYGSGGSGSPFLGC